MPAWGGGSLSWFHRGRGFHHSGFGEGGPHFRNELDTYLARYRYESVV